MTLPVDFAGPNAPAGWPQRSGRWGWYFRFPAPAGLSIKATKTAQGMMDNPYTA